MKTKSPESCYLCGSTHSKIIFPKVRDRDDIHVLQCEECHLVFLSRFDHISDEFYERSGMYSFQAPDVQKLEANECTDILRRFNTLLPFVSGKRYLDFGCGSGLLLKKIQSHCSVAEGVEPHQGLREWLIHSQGLTVYKDLKAVKQDAATKYDVISLFHVLEHLPDPLKILQEMTEVLAPGGTLILEIPSSNDALLKKYHCAAFEAFTYWSCHLFLWNLQNFPLLLKKTSLILEKIESVQRYPLSNHLYWLSEGKPGGHEIWKNFNSEVLQNAYQASLAEEGFCDTLVAFLQKPQDPEIKGSKVLF